MSTIKLYDVPLSGHAHRPRALLKLLNIEYQTIAVDMMSGEHKSPEFLKINPLGQVPAFIDDSVVLRESTAILVYLALKYDDKRTWLPSDPAAAQVQAWLSVSSKEVYEGPCAARISKLFKAPIDHGKAVEKAYQLFDTLFEPHLEKNNWLVGEKPTIADIANYAYIATAHEGEISLDNYPHISAWLKRIEMLEGFEKMPSAADIMA